MSARIFIFNQDNKLIMEITELIKINKKQQKITKLLLKSILKPSYSMKSTRLNKQNSVQRMSVSSARGIKEIPRVQIFLDSHINHAINKIKHQQNIKISQFQLQLINRKNSVHKHPQQNLNPAQQVKRKSTPNILSENKQNINLVPNQIVLSYIKEVYEKYGIRNPFQGYLDQKKVVNNKKQSINKKQKQYLQFQAYPSFSAEKNNKIEKENEENEGQWNENEQSIRTHKKQRKISQNQARINLLKQKFKQTIQNQAYEQEQQTIKKQLNLSKLKFQNNQSNSNKLNNKLKQTPIYTTFENQNKRQEIKSIKQINKNFEDELNSNKYFEQIKPSQGNITYIDRLTKLMQQSQINDTYDFQNDTTINKTNQQTPQRSLKHIHKFHDQTTEQHLILANISQTITKSIPQRKNHVLSKVLIHQSPQVIKPKKKLFVKTRATSHKFSSRQETPQNVKNIRVSFKDFETQPLSIESNKAIQSNKTIYGNKFEYGQDRKVQNKIKGNSMIKIEQSLQRIQDTKKQSQIKRQNQQQAKNYNRFKDKKQIQQIYRYCLGCQCAILEQNVKIHDGKCKMLRHLQNMSVKQIYEVVNGKINKLKYEISKSQLFNLSLKDLQQIKTNTAQLIFNTSVQKDNTSTQFNTSNGKQRQAIRKIDNILSQKVLKGCQLVKKLSWFTKLRQNIQQHLLNQSGLSKSDESVSKSNIHSNIYQFKQNNYPEQQQLIYLSRYQTQ